MRSCQDRVRDLLDAIAKIQERTGAGEEDFQRDEMLQVWVIHHLQIIGEAARGLPQDFRDRHPSVPWPQLVALRNILVHEYFGLNLHQVWMMAAKELPGLKAKIEAIRADEASG